MHSYLFVGISQKNISLEVSNFATTHGCRLIEFEAATIENIREIKRFAGLAQRENIALYLPHIDHSSEAAQNALLKSIEEPQEHLYFLLSATNEHALLETIRSRCTVIFVTSEINMESKKVFDTFITSSVGDLFTYITSLKKREDAITFLERFIEGGRKQLTQNPSYSEALAAAQQSLDALKQNGNVQIQLTQFLSHYLTCREAAAKVQ